MIDLGTVALVVGAYVAIISLYIWMDRRTTVISNHLTTQISSFKDEFNDFRAEVSGVLGEIVGELKSMNKGGKDGGEGGV